ncbi:hypothetical protein DYQ86_04605 [Acidobacteria bacterium AB60]|nr:hypothetical protein DYQ86_04605 [Acidobacteria bacterium AB60]
MRMFAKIVRMIRRLKNGLAVGVAALTPVLSSYVLTAAEAKVPSRSSQLLEQSWVVGTENRSHIICALLQTRQGYLWIGTNKGLVRFDGVRFTDFLATKTPGMSRGRTGFAAMWEDSQGGIWAGTDAGVTHYDGQHFTTLTTRDGLPSNSVVRIDGDETGRVWIYTRNGVGCWKEGKLRTIPSELDKQPWTSIITEFPRNGDVFHIGLWRRSGVSGVERFAYGHWRNFPITFQRFMELESIYEDSLHRVWFSIRTEPTIYYEVTPTNSLQTYQGIPQKAFVFFCDRDGFLWLTDHDAHTARWKNGTTYPMPGFRTPYLTHVIQRPNGALWAGTFNTRLFLFRPRLIDAIPMPESQEVGSVLFRQRNGTVWAAGVQLVRFTGNQGTIIAPLGKPNFRGMAGALGEDRYGHLLVGMRNYTGVRVLSANSRTTNLSVPVTSKHSSIVPLPMYSKVTGFVRAILMDAAQDEWFGTTTGLFHAHAGDTERVPVHLPGTEIRCLLEVAPGQLWIGTDKGPAILWDGKLEPFPPGSAWTSGGVSSLVQDQQGTIWISSTEKGVIRYRNGKFRTFDEEDGLPTHVIYSISCDPQHFWLRTDMGLLRIAMDGLLRDTEQKISDLTIAHYDTRDGIPSTEMAPDGNQGVLQFSDGTRWFSSFEGIASILPGVLEGLPSRPHAVIEEHSIDSSDLLVSGPKGIVVTPSQTSLEIHYTALGSFRPEQVKFRYRLAGIDEGWVPVHDRRAAFYTHLPPGSYTFSVQAADGDQSEWDQPAQIAVTVLTPFYKTWWMRTLLLLALTSAIAFVIELRRRQMLEAQRIRQAFIHRLLSSQESERKRIAHDLHDGLGQHLALIRTLALLPRKRKSSQQSDEHPAVESPEPLSSIAEQAAVAIREVEAICYGLRPYQLDRLGLTKAVRSLLRKLEEGNALFLRSSIDDIDGFFPPELEITFYRILQEAISNILKHSEASRAEITVICDGTRLRLSIQDNGRGFSMASGAAFGGSLGLIGIAERAEALGGHATIESTQQNGTRIVVEITRARSSDPHQT